MAKIRIIIGRKDGLYQKYAVNEDNIFNYSAFKLPKELSERYPEDEWYYRKDLDLELIGDEADTGNTIWFDKILNVYLEKDGDAFVRETNYLEVTETLSVETDEGNDVPLVCEITASTYVSAFGKDDIDSMLKNMQTSIDKYFKGMKGFDQIKNSVMKVGAEYKMRGRAGANSYPTQDVIIEKTKPRNRKYGSARINI